MYAISMLINKMQAKVKKSEQPLANFIHHPGETPESERCCSLMAATSLLLSCIFQSGAFVGEKDGKQHESCSNHCIYKHRYLHCVENVSPYP